MKRILFFVALVLGVVSCQTDPEGFGANVGGEQVANVTVTLPELTRANSAVGAVSNVDLTGDYTIRYIFQVYNSDFSESKDQQVKYSDDASVSFPVRLVPGRDYNFVVWADIVENANPVDGVKCADLHYNTANLANITLNDTWEAMDETRDAYTVSQLIEDFKGTEGYTLTLKRPFAKLRVITTDMAELLGLELDNATVTYVTKHYNTFNALQSKAVDESKNRDIKHENYTIKDYETTDGKVLFTDYFFAENDVVKFNMSVAMDDGKTVDRSFTTDIHVKRNHLTTLIGDILTEGNNITVKVEEGFAGENIVDANIKDQLEEATKYKNYVIDLEGDLIWETGGEHGSTPLIPDGAITETLTINGNGYKVIATGPGVGPIRMANGGKLIFNEVTLVDQTKSYAENSWEFGYLEVAGNLEFNDCVIDNTIAIDGEKAVFNNCTFNDKVFAGTEGQEYAAWVSNGEVEFNGCEFSGARGIKVHEQYSSEVAEVVVDKCQFNNLSKKPGMAIGTVNTATKIEIKNSTFTNCQPGDQGLFMYETDTNVATFEFSQTNNTVNAVVASSEVLANVIKADFHTLNISLNADVAVDVNANVADYYFGGNNTNTITINGAKVSTAAATGAGNNAYTLTFNHKNSDWNYVRLANADAKLVIKNAKITNSGNNNGPWNRHDISFFNNVELENVTSDKAIALFGDSDLTNVIISDVHPDNSEAYALWIRPYGQTVNMNNCALLAHESKTTDRGIKIDNQYVNEGEAKVTLNIDGLKVKSQKKAAIVVKSKVGADIDIKNIDITEVAADNANAVWVDEDAADYAALVNVTGASMFTEGAEIIEGNDKLDDTTIENNSVVYLGEGEYVIPAAAQGKTVKFVGTGNPEDTKVAVTKVGTTGENCDYGLDGSTVTFENITITTNSSTYIGYARCNGTYKNCIINGTYTLYGDSVFENCTFNVSGDVYNIWTWGAPTATFTNCTFNCDGKAMLLYGTANTKLTMNNCVFNDKGGLADLKAAIEIGNDYNKSYELIVNNATVNGFEINDKGIYTGTTLWANKNSMPADKLKVIIDGYTWVADGLSKKDGEYYVSNANGLVYISNNALEGGAAVKLNADINLEDEEFNGLSAFNPETNNTFDGQGHIVSNWTYEGGASDMGFIRQWVGPVKNIKFENCHLKTSGRSAIVAGKIYGNIDNVSVNNCSIEDSHWACGLVAGMYNAGSVSNVTVTNSSVKSNGGTGAIVGVFNETGGERGLKNCSVSNTTINNTGVYGEAYSGGALVGIFNCGATFTIEGCTVSNNTLEGSYVYEKYPADESVTIIEK